MATRAIQQARLSAALVRRRRPLRLPSPPAVPAPACETGQGWSNELRFFATCYAAGVVFFLVMLS